MEDEPETRSWPEALVLPTVPVALSNLPAAATAAATSTAATAAAPGATSATSAHTAATAARRPAEAAAGPATATSEAGPGGSTGPLEVLAAHLTPLPRGKVPIQLTAVKAGPGGCRRPGRGGRPGRGPFTPRFRPLVPLALLEIALVISSIDIAVAVGQNIVLSSRGPCFRLRGPASLSRPGFCLGSGGLAGASRPGPGTLSRPPVRTAGTDSFPRPGARFAGAGGQPVFVPRPVVKVSPFGGQGGRPPGTFANSGPVSGPPRPIPWPAADHIIMAIVDIDIVIAAGAPVTAAAPVTITMAPPVVRNGRHADAHRGRGEPGHKDRKSVCRERV